MKNRKELQELLPELKNPLKGQKLIEITAVKEVLNEDRDC